MLLIDTYDTLEGARHVVELAPLLARENIVGKAVRLDSGDLAENGCARSSIGCLPRNRHFLQRQPR